MRHSENPWQALRGVATSFWNAWEGLVYVLYTQEHMRFHFFAAILAVTLGVILGLDYSERAILFGIICVVLVLEVVNTSVESGMDHVSREFKPLVKRSKDAAAGAVLLAAFAAMVVAGYLMVPKLIEMAHNPDWLQEHVTEFLAFIAVPVSFGVFLFARGARALGVPVKIISPAAATFAFSAVCHASRDVFSFIILACGAAMLFNSMVRSEQGRVEREHIDLHPRHDLPELRFVVGGELIGFLLWMGVARLPL